MSQAQGKSLQRLSYETGIRLETLLNWCKKGRIIGARKHPLTKRWFVYPPCRLVTRDGDVHPWTVNRSALKDARAA